MHNLAIFIFRRDLRLEDNTGLIAAAQQSHKVIPVFILTPEQLVRNPYRSNNAVQFMVESLEDLNNSLRKKGSRLFKFFGPPAEVLAQLLKDTGATAVYVNRDYTVYAKTRDEKLASICQRNNVEFHSIEDILLHPVGSIATKSGKIYSKFTPYYNAAIRWPVAKPSAFKVNNLHRANNRIRGEYTQSLKTFYTPNPNIALHGGRTLGLKRLSALKNFSKYSKNHDVLAVPTTQMSAYIKFGCVSIREVYHQAVKVTNRRSELVRQLYWRDFYHNMVEYHPQLLSANLRERSLGMNIKWITLKTATAAQKQSWRAWISGRTGFPVVDAAMRQLAQTGYMHNRGRLIVSSFLVKNLGFHWAEGERYFATQLVDYDVCNNNGGWRFNASVGADATPYFRVLNPWVQSATHDPQAIYIKKWVPELRDVPAKHIHTWHMHHSEYPQIKYPAPIIDYATSVKKHMERFHH